MRHARGRSESGKAGEADMSGWLELLLSSTKLLEQAAPSAQFPPLQKNLDQLESLSKKLKAKTLRDETPSQFMAAIRGRSDRCIKFWNTLTGACLNSVDTDSQAVGVTGKPVGGGL